MTHDHVMEQLKLLVGRSFGVDPATLSEATCAYDVDGWDSLGHSTLLVRIRKAMDVDLDIASANQAQTLGELARVVGGVVE